MRRKQSAGLVIWQHPTTHKLFRNKELNCTDRRIQNYGPSRDLITVPRQFVLSTTP